MRATGIVRRIDDLGRIVIPREIRQCLGIKEGTPLELYVDGDTIVYKVYNDSETLLHMGQYLLETLKNKMSYDDTADYAEAIKITEQLIPILQEGANKNGN